MKKQLAVFIFNLFLLFGSVGLAIHFLPLAAGGIAAVLARVPVPAAESEITDDKAKSSAHTTNALNEEATPASHAVGSADGKDDRALTDTPEDIRQLMNAAKGQYKKSNARGATSEEAYFGGGTLLRHGNLEIRSKIPADFYTPDIKSLLKQDSDLMLRDKSRPTVLLYHSHTTEAYALLDKGFYIQSDARSTDPKRNVVRVGDALAQALEAEGFHVIHDRTIHDKEYNASYDESRKTVERYLEEYPSIEVTIDVHRDDITYSNKTKVKPTAVIMKKKAAQMMLIAGCEYGKVKHFPDWEYNLRFDLQVQQKVNELYPSLMRPILFSQRKYNMYETHNSFLLEVGTDANTLDEACYSARLFGHALGELMNEKYVKK